MPEDIPSIPSFTTPSKRRPIWLIVAISLLILLIGLGLYFFYFRPSKTVPAGPAPIHPALFHQSIDALSSLQGNAVTVTNQEMQNWQNCTLTLDADGYKNSYQSHLSFVHAGDSLTLPLQNFSSGSATADQESVPPQTLTVHCSYVEGQSNWDTFSRL